MLISLVVNAFKLLFFPLLWLVRRFAAPRDGYVVLEVDGRLFDLDEPSRSFLPWRRREGSLSVERVRKLGQLIAEDPRVKGVLVRMRSVIAGPAVLSSLREAFLEIRARGKDLVAYLPMGADTKKLYLASAARMIVVGPETTVAPLGFAVEGRYVRKALERAGVTPEVFAKGTYKSAGEMFVRDGMSDAHREQLEALLESWHAALVSALAQSRRVDRTTASLWIDEAPHSAKAAKELGIIDGIAYEDELSSLLLSKPIQPHDEEIPSVSMARYMRARTLTSLRPIRRPRVLGIVEVHGPIVGKRHVGFGRAASEDRTIAALRHARRNPAIRGVLLHIDSPGGSAIASDRIHHEVLRLKQEKPVVAYLSNVAASGGYYIAAGAELIIAQPETVTGSIGVISARFVLTPLMEKLGVFTDVVKRGARADLFSASRRLDPGERQVIEREIESFYQTFLGVVARGRNQPVEAIEKLAQGRVYSGVEAANVGLVDKLGGFELAIHELRSALGASGVNLRPQLVRVRGRTLSSPASLASSLLELDDSLLEEVSLLRCTEDEHVLLYCPIESAKM